MTIFHFKPVRIQAQPSAVNIEKLKCLVYRFLTAHNADREATCRTLTGGLTVAVFTYIRLTGSLVVDGFESKGSMRLGRLKQVSWLRRRLYQS